MSTMISSERDLEQQFIEKLRSLKYEYRSDICDMIMPEMNGLDCFKNLQMINPSV